MAITSKETLIDYCLRQLGAPVVKVTLDEMQINDCYETALQYYQNFHGDAVVKTFVKHQITQEDFDNKYISVPSAVLFVTRVLPFNSNNTNRTEFSLNYQLALGTMGDLWQMSDIVTYEMTRQHMNLIDMTFNGLDQVVRFNRHMNRLFIETDWKSNLRVGTHMVIEGYLTVDPEQYREVYNDYYLKRYLTALMKKQQGVNFKRFEGVQLPGGVTVNGQAMYDEAIAEIEKLETEMETKWEIPPMFFVG